MSGAGRLSTYCKNRQYTCCHSLCSPGSPQPCSRQKRRGYEHLRSTINHDRVCRALIVSPRPAQPSHNGSVSDETVTASPPPVSASIPAAVQRETGETARRENGNGEGQPSSSPKTSSPTYKDVSTRSLGPIRPEERQSFVAHLRHAMPYIQGHRGKTFVLVMPGGMSQQPSILADFLSDVAQLHAFGVRLVLVMGVKEQVDERLRKMGRGPHYVKGYRVTDEQALQVAVQEAAFLRLQVESALSKPPEVGFTRRHIRNSADHEVHYEPGLTVVSGNYVTARRRGVVDGVDFGATGTVRFVQVDEIKKQLHMDNVVLLSNLAFNVAGEVLNCNTYDVAVHAATELSADKIVFCVGEEVSRFRMRPWFSLKEAEKAILEHCEGVMAMDGVSSFSMDISEEEKAARVAVGRNIALRGCPVLDLDVWQAIKFPNAVVAAVEACKRGVTRAHLVDAREPGFLQLELYTRDGTGTMISTDLYEGIRTANIADVAAIDALLRPLAEQGIMKPRTLDQIRDNIAGYTLIEREGKVFGCAQLLDMGTSPDGLRVAEVAAFTIAADYRGGGRGDSLLDYVEQRARADGLQRLVLLTTRTADWFKARNFLKAGDGEAEVAVEQLLPEWRLAQIDRSRGSEIYHKSLEPKLDDVQPGQRIGF